MRSDSFDSLSTHAEVEVTMDGLPVDVPSNRNSLSAIRAFLESAALQEQRALHSFLVNGRPMNLSQPVAELNFICIEAETISLNQLPLQLISAALQQTESACSQVQSAIAHVLINDSGHARQIWWQLVANLKVPLLTLSLLPESIYTPADGSASVTTLRQWQLQQLGAVIKDVDEVCRWGEPADISEALEKRALPWLAKMREFLLLLRETVLSDPRAAYQEA